MLFIEREGEVKDLWDVELERFGEKEDCAKSSFREGVPSELNCFRRFLLNSTLNVTPSRVALSNAATAWKADSTPRLSQLK
jgi:hypothetical protein